jgi:capsular exopolysaccharide synthesis family protein
LQGNQDRINDLERIGSMLRRRVWLVVLCAIVAGAAAFGVSALQTKQYTASSSLLFRSSGFAEDLFGSSTVSPTSSPTREAATNEHLVGLEVVSKLTSEALDGRYTRREVSNAVTIEPNGEADIVSVRATNTKPDQAALIANTFAGQFIAFRKKAERATLLHAKGLAEEEFERLTPPQQHGPRGESLSRAAEKLSVLASLQTGNVELVQPAVVPSSPSSPNTTRNCLVGVVLGFIFGVALSFLLERLNRKIRDPEEAREILQLPILGTVPESKAIVRSNEGASAVDLPFVETEAFRTMRASLRYFNVDNKIRSVVLMSALAKTGKTTVAWNLARANALFASTVLVETDLRKPSLAGYHSLKRGPGLSELLTGQAELADVVQRVSVAPPDAAHDEQRWLDVVVAGSVPPNPADLIESQTMADLLTQLTESYDLVVIDSTPLGVIADAYPLLTAADGVILVVKIEDTSKDEARDLREQIDRLGAHPLGVVANGIKLRRRGRYGYGYGYGAYGEPDVPADDVSESERAAVDASRS